MSNNSQLKKSLIAIGIGAVILLICFAVVIATSIFLPDVFMSWCNALLTDICGENFPAR